VPYRPGSTSPTSRSPTCIETPGSPSASNAASWKARSQQDNELWHLLILRELIVGECARESQLKFFWLPLLIAFGHYQFSWLRCTS
jgi:hypothetical protein